VEGKHGAEFCYKIGQNAAKSGDRRRLAEESRLAGAAEGKKGRELPKGAVEAYAQKQRPGPIAQAGAR
jgi:hypothetical protein